MSNSLPDLRAQINFRTEDNGEEVLWAEQVGPGSFRVLSVPVFAYGISRGTTVLAKPKDPEGHLAIVNVKEPSPGATFRVYLPTARSVKDFYVSGLLPIAESKRLDIGPATFLEPKVLAVHLADRARWQSVASVLDEMASSRQIDFWELGDPDLSPQTDPGNSTRQPWRLVHPPPGDPFSEAFRED
jgi:hypothetical protein